jgi:hypothetical protein
MAKREAFVFTDRTPPRSCPACQRVLDGATGVSVDPAEPQPRPATGDITVCAYCHSVLVYTTDGFRVAGDADLERLEPDLRELVLAFIAQARRAD